MRNQLLAGLFCCVAAQATAFTIWANYHEGHPNLFSFISVLAMWYSCYSLCRTLSRKEYLACYHHELNQWATPDHPHAIVRFGTELQCKPRLFVLGSAVWSSDIKDVLTYAVVRPRFFLFTHWVLRDSYVTAHLVKGQMAWACDRKPSLATRAWSWLLRAEYVEYSAYRALPLEDCTVRDVHGRCHHHSPSVSNYFAICSRKLLAVLQSTAITTYQPELPVFLTE